MAGGGATCGRRGGPGARYLRSGGACCFREPPLLQDGGAGDGSREPRAGQVTRVAGEGAGRLPFRSCFKTFHAWRWERSRGLVVDSKRQRKAQPLLWTMGRGRCMRPAGWQRPPAEQQCQWAGALAFPGCPGGTPPCPPPPPPPVSLAPGTSGPDLMVLVHHRHGWPRLLLLASPVVLGPCEHMPPSRSHVMLRQGCQEQQQVHVQGIPSFCWYPEWPVAKDCAGGGRLSSLSGRGSTNFKVSFMI
ncbi:unnamed protein product [Nyctereutes procyonoides]|uniref:(raccoon dog) hypothetical protein n=1 Tax=Nyctereutes procyonoides TaxID=34880 RepID=A0A811ZWP4_NYCPR|nr:unnamed protein product [Nyctereutes procyonoides]